ncbi:MAG: nucleotidyltransferase family protein [bacterium]|nr:nucleotidyltransferase family protein [bacterium]
MTKEEIQQRFREVLPTLPHADHLKKVALFGSHLHRAAGPESDIDLLVEFSKPVSYFQLSRMEQHLTNALGSRVDLVSSASLSPYFRTDVLREAESLYEQ